VCDIEIRVEETHMDADGIEEADLNELKVEFESNIDATKEKMETLTGQSQ
jgi:hypothetical protein